MSARKRVIQALNHEEPDRVPLFCQIIMPGFKRELLNYWGDSYTRERKYKLSYRDYNLEFKLGFDMSWGFDSFPIFIPQKHMQENPLPKLPDNNKYLDYNGRIFLKQRDRDMGDAYYMGPYMNTEEKADYFHDTYFAIEWEEAPDFAININKRLKKFPTDEFVPCCHLDPILEPLWEGLGLGLLIKLIRKNKSKIKHYIELRAKKLITSAKLNAETDFDVFFMCDDTALKNTTMINPKYHRELIIPAYKQAVQILRKAGKHVCFHSDGFTEPYFEGLIEAGFSGVESLEPMAGVNLKHLKEEYGDKLCLIGNIDVSQLLPYGTKDDVKKAVKKCIRDAGEGGGYMLSACTDITNSCKLDNVLTMISATKKYGVYPLML
ncbi:MAG: uroporphyrinogen decarboxylase family protein [Promethearchaeota archaeon]